MDFYIHPSEIRRDPPRGAHMPLDTSIHWSWRNPLNILPVLLLLVLTIALVGSLLPLA